MSSLTPTIVVAGGGTAGHIEPALAVAEALVRRYEVTVEALGTPRGLETEIVPGRGFQLHLITPVPIPRSLNSDVLRLPFRLTKAVRETRRILKDTEARAVLGTGGYVAAPAYLAAKSLGIPFYVLESNAIAGMANKLGVKLGGVGFNAVAGSGLEGEVIGIPVRPGLGEDPDGVDSARARELWGLSENRPTILVTGGSQGAQSINEAIIAAREALIESGYQILHAVGKKNEAPAPMDYYVGVAYIDDMAAALAIADMVISRAGAMTVAEVTAAKIPALYVPLPHGNGEQARNADEVVEAGAARRVRNADLTSELVIQYAQEILGTEGQPGQAEKMQAAYESTSVGAVADLLADRIYADISASSEASDVKEK